MSKRSGDEWFVQSVISGAREMEAVVQFWTRLVVELDDIVQALESAFGEYKVTVGPLGAQKIENQPRYILTWHQFRLYLELDARESVIRFSEQNIHVIAPEQLGDSGEAKLIRGVLADELRVTSKQGSGLIPQRGKWTVEAQFAEWLVERFLLPFLKSDRFPGILP